MCALLAAWWLAYLYPLVTIDDVVGSLMTAGDSTAQGSPYNQALLICWAGFGIVHFPRAARALQSSKSRTLLTLLSLYLFWAVLSIAWSEDLQLTVRRLVALTCLLAGGFGLGAGFYGRTRNSIATIAKHAIYAAGICVVLLFALRLSQGNLLDLLNPQWTLKYTTTIETYAFPLVFAIVGATFLFHDRPVYRAMVGGALFLVLILLKGRTMVVDVASAAGLVYSRITRFRILRVAALAVSCALAGLLADLMTGGEYIIHIIVNMSDSIAAWMPYLSIGDGLRNITSLSGRLPLWQALLRYAGQRPYVGYGFGAFWGPSRFGEIFAATKWHAVVAHNGFLDEILATGLVGLTLLLTFWIYGMYISFKLRSGGYVVFGWMLLFLFLNVMSSIIQSFFAYPTLIVLVALGAVMDECSAVRCARCGARLESRETPAGELVLCHA
jgi:O-antigen ligase